MAAAATPQPPDKPGAGGPTAAAPDPTGQAAPSLAATAAATPAPAAVRAGQRSAGSRFLANPAVRVSMLIIAAVVALALIGPFCVPAAYQQPSPVQLAEPSLAHWLGTDLNGRDQLYRVFIGARISLMVGLAGALVSLFVGTSYGLVAGYAGGRLDGAMMRTVDVIYSIPRLIFVIVIVSIVEFRVRSWLQGVFGGSHFALLRALPDYTKTIILIVSLGLVEWLTMARIIRGQVLVLKNMQFVTAARSLGQTHFKILTRHLLPNLTGIIAVYLTLTIPAIILDESFLSYLGLGVDASQASWGTLLSDGSQAVNPVKSNWWLLVFPALIMSATLLALNFLGDGLRDALDPKST